MSLSTAAGNNAQDLDSMFGKALEYLLPVRYAIITVQFSGAVNMPFFHQVALQSLLKSLIFGEKKESDTAAYRRRKEIFSRLVICDVLEPGRVYYAGGEYYRFGVFFVSQGGVFASDFFHGLMQLPPAVDVMSKELKPTSGRGLFIDNLRFAGIHDGLTAEPLASPGELSQWTLKDLQCEVEHWRGSEAICMRFLALARIRKETDRGKNRPQYCRDITDMTPKTLVYALYNRVAALMRFLEPGLSLSPVHYPNERHLNGHVFWFESQADQSRAQNGRSGVLAQGLSGVLNLGGLVINNEFLTLLIVCQIFGIGQNCAQGWGRYVLERSDGERFWPRVAPCRSMLDEALEWENLQQAFQHVRKSRIQRVGAQPNLAERLNPRKFLPSASSAKLLSEIRAQLGAGTYMVPPLNNVSIPKADGGVRQLNVPPFMDRVAQRAVVQVLSPALECLFDGVSHGFRPQRSRITAIQEIECAYKEGYRWVFEADIKQFFDSVHFQLVEDRLKGLWHQDRVLEPIMAWLKAPSTDHQTVEQRDKGLPQGSPLSPLLANLLLDDFDNDMNCRGFRLIRFADDFVIVTKTEDAALQAMNAAKKSLTEHGFALNLEKTRISTFAQGFEFLGYVVVNGLILERKHKKSAYETSSRDVGGAGEIHDSREILKPSQVIDPAFGSRHDPLSSHVDSVENDVFEAQGCDHPDTPVVIRDQLHAAHGTLLSVTGQPSIIYCREHHIQVERNRAVVHRLPWRHLAAVLICGQHHITAPALRAAFSAGVPVYFADGIGRYQGCAAASNTLSTASISLLRRQLDFRGKGQNNIELAKRIVSARIIHQVETLRRRKVDSTFREFKRLADKVESAQSLSQLNGYEGQASKLYFGLFKGILDPDDWAFNGRNRRPPKDPVNALLSLGYTYLYSHMDTYIRIAGLHPGVGFYHQGESPHSALASDLMEPFRHLVETAVLTLIARRQVIPENFETTSNGCNIHVQTRRLFLSHLSARLAVTVKDRGTQQPANMYQAMYRQVLSYRSWLQSGEDFCVWGGR